MGLSARQEVTAPDGRVWAVRRRWVKWRPRFRPNLKLPPEIADAGFAIEDGVVIFVAIMVLLLLLAFGAPLLAAALELILGIFIVIGAILSRILLRRPFPIEATSADGDYFETFAVGLGGSRRAVERIAEGLASGRSSDELVELRF